MGFGASVGIAVSTADDTTSSLLNRADTGLYAAKHGRVLEPGAADVRSADAR